MVTSQRNINEDVIVKFISRYSKAIEEILEQKEKELWETFLDVETKDAYKYTKKEIKLLMKKEKKIYKDLSKPAPVNEQSVNRLANMFVNADRICDVLKLEMDVWHLFEQDIIDVLYNKMDGDREYAMERLMLREIAGWKANVADKELRNKISIFIQKIYKEYWEKKQLSIKNKTPSLISEVDKDLGKKASEEIIDYITNAWLTASRSSLDSRKKPRYDLLSILKERKNLSSIDYANIPVNIYKYLPADMQEAIYRMLTLNKEKLSLGENGWQTKYLVICNILGIDHSWGMSGTWKLNQL